MTVREEVFKALEIARKDKVIGNSLGAALDLYPADSSTYELLKQFANLDTLFIVSQVHLHPADAVAPEDAFRDQHVAVVVGQAEGEKCERCWMVTPEVGKHEHAEKHPSLCTRCAEVVANHF